MQRSPAGPIWSAGRTALPARPQPGTTQVLKVGEWITQRLPAAPNLAFSEVCEAPPIFFDNLIYNLRYDEEKGREKKNDKLRDLGDAWHK